MTLTPHLENLPTALRFTAEVTEIRELARVDGRQVWQVLLNHTHFQPATSESAACLGTLEAVSRSGIRLQVAVATVQQDANGDLWHTLSKPLQAGTAVVGHVNVS